ncbi:LacI family DNA-binding transcriptional regulator [Petroclostridium sp. X23]|uniref:LacI family DNA-binding transcriptional regulator n=1 Tax=Petroclostridium sp. X23 TaxID=3045146 RepID=UPI0024AD0717|nr:LacI family DNA-binding transcriptional regulator [Petroclostridium sp. X23]WHH61009.1 LacI family DNA-binding transcriptional regulator [Petroclostridium sp. X23]
MSVTIKDIAKAANVSYATVSRALSDHPEVSGKTKTKIKQLAKDMGYTPNALAKGLVTKNTHTLGLIIPDITNPFFTEVAQGIEDCANRNGYQVFLCNSNWNLNKEKEYLKALYGKRVDGIVIGPVSNEVSYLINERNGYVPIVFAAYKPLCEGCSFVVTDDYKSAVIATEYVIKLGHKKIAFIGGQEDNTTNQDRLKGYHDTLEKYGIPILPYYVRYGQFKQQSGYTLTKDLLIKNDVPTAILAGNDIIALGVIQAVEEFGLHVPSDISVVGFDDISFASLDKIQLTTIHQPKYKIGELCVEIILDQLQDIKSDPIQRIVEPQLMIRKTCKGV